MNQINGGCQTAHSEPHQTSERERSSELFTPKSGYLFRQKAPSQMFGKALNTPLTLVKELLRGFVNATYNRVRSLRPPPLVL